MIVRELEKLFTRLNTRKAPVADADKVSVAGLKKTEPSTLSYSRKHRGQWFRPEYDFRTIQIAQQADGILLRTIKKKADRILLSGYEFVSPNEEALDYIKRRIRQMDMVSNKPFKLLVRQTAEDLIRQNNCMWAKVRSSDSSSGRVRTDLAGNELEPVASYYVLPFETLEFKTKLSGEFKKIRQVLNSSGDIREFRPVDVVHFYTDMKPGYVVGTPELLPALDDIALLRRIEDNVEDLIETNLFPVFHYRIGTDDRPEVVGPSGKTESQVIREKLEYMPPGSIYVSDHRHEITALGSEGKALVIDQYLEYFKKRAIASAGATEVDLGMDGGSSRSTANTLSKSMTMDVEAVQRLLEIFINFYVISELLLEGGFDPLDPADEVTIRFGVIDHEARIALENNQIQLFTNNVRTLTQVRHELGDPPMSEEDYDDTFFKLFAEPLALAKAMSAGSAAGETLAETATSNVSPEAVNKEKQFAKQQEAAKAKAKAAQAKRPSSGSRTSSAKARPRNQHGTRSAPKLNRDTISLKILDEVVNISLDFKPDETKLAEWERIVQDRYLLVKDVGVSLETVASSLLYRLEDER